MVFIETIELKEKVKKSKEYMKHREQLTAESQGSSTNEC